MIRTKTIGSNKTELLDESANLPADTLALVQYAMRAGLTEFTTPTPEDDDGRTDWKVCTWVAKVDGRIRAFMVARKVLFEHFEVMGPEIALPVTNINAGPSVHPTPTTTTTTTPAPVASTSSTPVPSPVTPTSPPNSPRRSK